MSAGSAGRSVRYSGHGTLGAFSHRFRLKYYIGLHQTARLRHLPVTEVLDTAPILRTNHLLRPASRIHLHNFMGAGRPSEGRDISEALS